MKIDTTALYSDYGDDNDDDRHHHHHHGLRHHHHHHEDDDDDCFTENTCTLTSVRVKSIAPSHCPFILPSHSIDLNDLM